jgi:hypothetical protein
LNADRTQGIELAVEVPDRLEPERAAMQRLGWNVRTAFRAPVLQGPRSSPGSGRSGTDPSPGEKIEAR